MTNFEKVQEFHRLFGIEKGFDEATFRHRCNLIAEEGDELFDELFFLDDDLQQKFVPNVDKQKLAKELADLLYVVYGAADVFSIPIDEVFAEVHRSNMSKLGGDGKPVRREDGKVLKGPNYSPANLEGIVNG